MNGKLIGVSQAISETIKIFMSGIQNYLILGLAFAVATLLISLVYAGIANSETVSIMSLLLTPVQFLLSLFATGSFLYLTLKTDKGEMVSVQGVLQAVAERFLPLLLISVISFVVIGGGFLLFIIPGIIFAVWFFAANLVFFDKGITGWQALMESKRLVTGHFWGVIFLGVVGALIYLVFAIVAGIFFGMIGLSIVFDALSSLASVVGVIYGYVIYKSLNQISTKVATPATPA